MQAGELGVNFLSVYQEATGTAETFPGYHKFAGLAVIAACLSYRVWLEIERFRPLYPNQYVLLIGEAASGKGTALSTVLGLLKPFREDIAIYEGSITAPMLADKLSGPPHAHPEAGFSEMFFLSSELADSLGMQETASAFVKRLTMLYTGDLDQFHHATRMHGDVQVEKAILTTLICSTMDWLCDNLQVSDVKGGFVSRCLVSICPSEWPPKRVFATTYPDNWENLIERLRRRVAHLLSLRGKATLTTAARQEAEKWYLAKPLILDGDLRAAQARIKELTLKVSLLLAAANRVSLEIELEDVQEAISIVEAAKQSEQPLLEFISNVRKVERQEINYVTATLKQRGSLTWSDWLRAVSPRGVTADRLRRQAEQLLQEEKISMMESEKKGRKTKTFTWIY